ncbi:uncharacterized protein LOC110865855 isoform X2 [Helianthus annuus]|uniref:uncharacterized protein LOC110865855 isoform X2 n=1 Tax=Helianthus annuus TaxID=4232 RepID=UPI000B8F77E2|nr:uncharacterized protein LOC110865855 isoform X2 [Helianthus annuus]
MEPDLPLIQMAEEDDSLIQHLPDLGQTPSKSSLNFSTFSPFALPPSNAKKLKGGVRMEKPSSSSSEAINNKENINLNSVEVPKLGMEPMQMKRRKTGAGFNLRKSLAWDRAFFTDEGILDPAELTLITGIDANTCGGGLPSISEEGNSSFSSDASCTNESNAMEASEETPLKGLRDKNRTPKGKNREKTDCSLRNHGSLLHHNVTHKVLSSDRTNRGGSKLGGCSEPLSASSLKRPANSNTLKTAKRESKLPKLPISKRGSYFDATENASKAASQLRRNLIPKPTKTVEQNFGSKSSLQNVQGCQSKAKTGSGNAHLPVRELAQKTVKYMSHSSKTASSTRSRLVQVDRVNSRSELVPDTLQLCKVQEESAPLAAKHLAQHATAISTHSSKVASSTKSRLVQVDNDKSGPELVPDALRLFQGQEESAPLATKHLARHAAAISDRLRSCESQECPAALARPSGLRMPSPSLRLFGMSTASESTSLQQKKFPHYMGSDRKYVARTPMKSNDITENIACGVLTSSKERCAPSTQLSPSPNYMLNSSTREALDSNIYQNLVRKNVPRVGFTLDFECGSSKQEKKVSHPTEQLAGNVGTCHQLMPEGRVPETKYKEDGCKVVDDSPCSRIISITSRDSHSIEHEADVIDSKGINTSSIPFQNVNAEQRNDDADSVDVFPTTTSPHVRDLSVEEGNDIHIGPITSIRSKTQLHDSPVRDTLIQLLNDNPSAEGFNIGPTTSFENEHQLPVTLLLHDNPSSQLEDTGTAPVVEAQHKIPVENHKSQELGISAVVEKSPDSRGNISEAEPTVQGCTGESETHSQFQSGNQTLEGSGAISNISKTNVEDGQVQLLNVDVLVQSCSRLTSEEHNHSIEQAGFSNTAIKMEQVWNVAEGSDVYACDPRPPNTVIAYATSPVVEEIGNSGTQLCVEYRTSGSVVYIDPIAEHNESYSDGQSTECGDHSLTFDSELQQSAEDKTFVENSTCMESCSLPTDSILEEKSMFLDERVLMKDSLLSAENISDSVIVVPEENSDASAKILPVVQVNEKSNSSFSEGQGPTTGVETASIPELCCLVGGGDESLLTKATSMTEAEGSKIIIGEQVDATPMVGEFQHEMDDGKGAAVYTKRSNSIKMQDNSLVIHPPNAVPFSDEWLAAFEAAGEEILTMKCGAVQHSPQDKSLPEPSPWSPVKKKGSQIGPYDCTKYTNVMP